MAGAISLSIPAAIGARPQTEITGEPAWVRWTLIGAALAFLLLFLFLPLVAVFTETFRKGAAVFFASFHEADVLSAIKLTFITAAIAVPLNLVFGLAAAWCIGKFTFSGRSLLITLIDLPFAVSPVVSGLIYVCSSACKAGLDRGCASTTSRSSSPSPPSSVSVMPASSRLPTIRCN